MVANGSEDHVIQLEEVTKVYPMGQTEVRALDGVSLTIGRGGFWAIMGSSGSGKSTMLNLIGCLDRPTTGRYIIEGQDVADLDDDSLSDLRLRHLGFIFQSFNLIPQLTVRENIELPLFYLGWEASDSAKRAEALAEEVGLGERLDHRPAELSGGQQQRVAIARSLANDPPILLADEPTGNLDSATGEQIMALLERLHSEGRTIIMVTHEQEIADHAACQVHMRDGVIDRIERREGGATHGRAASSPPSGPGQAASTPS
jgi:putative ABC transport system ATP-binding protein